jgi:hypothetical protein
LYLPAVLGAAALLHSAAFAAVEIKQEADKVTVAVGGKPFTQYRFREEPHVYFYPLLGPGGEKMTRSWPMEEVPGEERDHPHHKSLWFSHGDVNGIDFWAEQPKDGRPARDNVGKIVHDKFLEVKGGDKEGVISSLNNWVAPDGSIYLTSKQTFRVFDTGVPQERLFDFEVVLTAGAKDIKFGDTKEGSMAIRVAESMRVTMPKPDRAPGKGHMLSSEGLKDVAVWGKRAKWVDYTGPVNGKTMGITIFDHPSNHNYPTRWHARDYGLFAANPFSSHEMDPTTPKNSGDVKLAAGKSLTLRYRFLIHEGDAAQGKVAEHAARFEKSK